MRGQPVDRPQVHEHVQVAEDVGAPESGQRAGGRDREGEEEEGGERFAPQGVLVSQLLMFAGAKSKW